MKALVALLACLSAAAATGAEAIPPRASMLHQLAAEGNADAQYALGLFFLDRQGDGERAVPWLERAARQDHPHAALKLGLVLAGDEPPFDPEAAVRWIAFAAEAGLAEAAAELGLFHFEGFGPLEPDCEAALHWLEIGDLKRSAAARNNLVWVLATCPEAGYRNGRRALQLGLQVVYRDGLYTPGALDTLAAAFAEVGDFLSAIEVQREAIELLEDAPDRYPGFLERLERYRERQPWRRSGAGVDRR